MDIYKVSTCGRFGSNPKAFRVFRPASGEAPRYALHFLRSGCVNRVRIAVVVVSSCAVGLIPYSSKSLSILKNQAGYMGCVFSGKCHLLNCEANIPRYPPWTKLSLAGSRISPSLQIKYVTLCPL